MLLNYFDERNKVILQGKSVWYQADYVLGSWTGTTVVASAASVTYGAMWRYSRFATKHYKYVGMDYATAQQCADAMVQKYTRSTRLYQWSPIAGEMGDWLNLDGGQTLMAIVSIILVDGKMYDVDIIVDEHDEKWSKKEQTFSWSIEDNRDYDE